MVKRLFFIFALFLTGCTIGQPYKEDSQDKNFVGLVNSPIAPVTVLYTDAPIATAAQTILLPTESAKLYAKGTAETGSDPGLALISTVNPIPVGLLSISTPTSAAETNCYSSKYIADVSITDGTVLLPKDNFIKTWRIQNTGTCTWTQGFGLIFESGEQMDGNPVYLSTNDAVQPGGAVDISIAMAAPSQSGTYIGNWLMASNSGGSFGTVLTVVIKVKK